MPHYAWIRYRTRHSSGPSDWMFREVAFESEPSEKSSEFRDLLESLDDELSTGTEHWRGIDAEIITPTRAMVREHITSLRDRILDLHAAQTRAEELLANLPPDPDAAKIWTNRWYAAADEARNAALREDPNDFMGANAAAVDAAIEAWKAENL